MFKLKNFLLMLVTLMVIPFASAYSSWSYNAMTRGYLPSPLEFFNNEWTIFVIIFLVFFSVIFYTVNRSFKNPAISATIALALGLLIALTFSRRGMLYDYAGSQIGTWVLIAVSLISIVFLFRFLYESIGTIGPIIGAGAVWFVLFNIDPYAFFPYEILTPNFVFMYNLISGFWGLVIIIIVALLISISMRRWEFGHGYGYGYGGFRPFGLRRWF